MANMSLNNAITMLTRYTEANELVNEAIKIVLDELGTLQMNYALLEERFDGSAEEKVDKLTEKLKRQKQIVKDVRHVAFEEGYNQGFIKGVQSTLKPEEV